MIIDETFIWLYVASKVSDALCILGAISAVVSIISALTIAIGLGDRNWTNALVTARRMLFTTLITAFISLSLCALLPSKNDAASYAAYEIGRAHV